MNQPVFLPSPPPVKSKTPVLGIIACVAAVLSICLGCGILGVLYALGAKVVSSGSLDPNAIDVQAVSGYVLAVFALMCGSGLSSLAGIGTGIASVIVDRSKAFGIIGLVLSILVLLGECGFYILSYFLTASSIPVRPIL